MQFPAPIDRLTSRALKAVSGRLGPVVPAYHSIGSSESDWAWTLALSDFEAHLDLIDAYGWQTVNVRDLLELPVHAQKTVAITFDDGYEDNLAAAEALAKRNMCATWFIVSNEIAGCARWDGPAGEARPMMSANHLRDLANSGFEIGGHSRNHCRLSEQSPEILSQEIAGCKSELEDLLGSPLVSFAYPYGDHDQKTVDETRAAGFKIACSTNNGWAHFGDDPWRIRRFMITVADSVARFETKLAIPDDETGAKPIIKHSIRVAASKLGMRTRL